MNISRGFHRIGIVLAAFPLISAIFWVSVVIWGGGSEKETPAGFAILSLIIAAAVYALARGIGWIVQGFSRA